MVEGKTSFPVNTIDESILNQRRYSHHPMNNVAMIGPQFLQDYDKEEIFPFLNEIIDESRISILAYRSFELDVIRHFLTLPDEYASHLTIYLVNTFDDLDHYGLSQSIRYLSSAGATVIELQHPEKTLTRKPYLELWKRILVNQDELLSFYNHQTDEQAKLLSPLRVAEELEKNAYVFHLSGGDEEKMKRPHKQKIEQVNILSDGEHSIR
jgi:hypothetical protein